MLKIQEFIFEHKDNWKELLSAEPYSLIIKEEDGFILFKYNQLNSDFSQEICCEARGLILDSTDNFKVVRMAFKKFFNIGEYYASKIDWNTATATEKIDGSIISIWYARNKWHISTNNNINAFNAELVDISPYRSFGELFESVLPLSKFIGNRYENICFTFELVSPYNKVVINYPNTKVYLLSMRYVDNLEESSFAEVKRMAKELNIECPELYSLNVEEDYLKLVENMPEGHEGIVVRDGNNNRVKIKTLLYFQLHKLKNNGIITYDKVIELIKTNEQSEFLSYFPEYTEIFNNVKEAYDILRDYILSVLELADDMNTKHKSRKEIACAWFDFVNRCDNHNLNFHWRNLKGAYFARIDNPKCTVDNFLDTRVGDTVSNWVESIIKDMETFKGVSEIYENLNKS